MSAGDPYPQTVRVALLSDTHGHLDPWVLAEALECEWVAHAGDIGCAAVLDALATAGRPPLAVRGNNDVPAKWPSHDHGRLASLPLVGRLVLAGGSLVVVHGHRAGPALARHERLRREYPDARVVVYGHSHRAVIDRSAEPWVVNPGAAGRTRTFGGASYVRLVAGREGWDLELRQSPLVATSSREGRRLDRRPGPAGVVRPRRL